MREIKIALPEKGHATLKAVVKVINVVYNISECSSDRFASAQSFYPRYGFSGNRFCSLIMSSTCYERSIQALLEHATQV